MKPELKIAAVIQVDSPDLCTGSPMLDSNPRYLNKFLSHNGRDIAASDVSKYRLMPPTQTPNRNKYPVEACREFMRDVSSAGFGSILNDTGANKRSVVFRKRSWNEMEVEQQSTLKKININSELYDSFLNLSTSMSSSSGDGERCPWLSTPTENQESDESQQN